MIELESGRIAVHQLGVRRRMGIYIAVGSAIAFVMPYLVQDFFALWFSLAGAVGMMLGAIIFASARRDPGKTVGDGGRLILHDDVLEVDTAAYQYTQYAEELAAGWLERGHGHDALVIRTKRANFIEAQLYDDNDIKLARKILSGLGLDAKAVQMTVGSASAAKRGWATGCLYLSLLLGGPSIVLFFSLLWSSFFSGSGFIGVPFILSIAVVATIVASMRALASAEITIGGDGVRVKRGRFRKTFIPHDKLEAVERFDDAVIFHQKSGTPLKIMTQNTEAAVDLRDRVRRAHTAYLQSESTADVAALDRDGRGIADWRARLKTLLAGAGTYRKRVLNRDDLFRVLEDPAATPERRVGAAFALSGGADDDGRQRIRIAASGCAQEPLRIAIESAADGELEAQQIEEVMRVYEQAER